MSSIEERLVQDIAAVTGGVVVTESDLKQARDEVEGRVEIRRRRDRQGILVAAAAAAAVGIAILGVVAVQLVGDDETAPVQPAPTSPPSSATDVSDDFLTGSPPTPENLEGVWRVDNGTIHLSFTTDGVARFDNRGGVLFSDPAVIGTYDIVDDLITITVDGGTAGCAGQTFAMRGAAPEPGLMRLLTDEPGTGLCANMTGRWVLEHVLPANESFAGLTPPNNEGRWQPLTDKDAVPGLWVPFGGGSVLEMSPGGRYAVAAGAGDLVDQGQWTFEGSELSLVSDGDSPTCPEGDRLVLSDMELANPGTSMIRGTLDQNTCGGTWTSAEGWYLVPDARS